MDLTTVFLVWLVFINLFAIAIFAIDKRRAIKSRWRISEATLLTVALVCGGFGALAGMKLFRHKTQKAKFFVGVPFLCVVNVACIVAMFVWVL